jgi:iron complex outermembrane receptor protein
MARAVTNNGRGFGIITTVGLLGVAAAGSAYSQDQQPATSGALEEVVVTGTRRTDTTVAESPSPIDIISGETLSETSFADMTDVLRTQVVALNVARFSTNDGAAFVRPFSLRGLPPDETLFLVNGKRRHRSAVVQLSNQPLARGSQGPDLQTIPTIAIEQLEVLRDGASAQYGSDAIAGVINFRLKDSPQGATITTRYGQFYKGDGQDVQVEGNLGLPLTADGFFNISGEYVSSDTTSRGVQRPDAQALIDAGNTAVPVPAQRWGNPENEAWRLFFNAGVPLSENAQLYAFGNYGESEGETGFFYRFPSATTNAGVFRSVPLTNQPGGPRFSFLETFPGGFSPIFGSEIEDESLVGGLKGEFGSGLRYDFSGSFGRSDVAFNLKNTINPSLGPDSPFTFDVGATQQIETNGNADFVYPWETGVFAAPLNVAFGAEYRREKFKIDEGEPASYTAGPFASVLDPDTGQRIGLAVGSSGFPGFSPLAAGEWSRNNWAAYLDLETDVTERLSLGVAARQEDFSDFGSTFNWKVSGRLELTNAVAVRASVNTGFRAPTPGQSNISDVQTNIDVATARVLLTATLPPADPIAQFFGAQALQPEESFNIAGGLVFTPIDDLLITLDYFDIEVEDRIGVTGNIVITPADRAGLAAAGITGADSFERIRFFGNFFDTRTKGIDLVSSYAWRLSGDAKLGVSLSANYTDTEVTKIRDARAIDRERRTELEDFAPEMRGIFSIDYSQGPLSLLARANYYSEWTDAILIAANPADTSLDQTFGAEWMLDLEVSYDLTDAINVTLGGQNVLDEYPDKDRRPAQQNIGVLYGQFSPIGYNGGFWYARATVKF